MAGLVIASYMLQIKAKQVAEKLPTGDEDFVSSNGWFVRFKNAEILE